MRLRDTPTPFGQLRREGGMNQLLASGDESRVNVVTTPAFVPSASSPSALRDGRCLELDHDLGLEER
jgi:hypothetical protein